MLTIYKTKNCGYCPMITAYLKRRGVEFEEVYLEDKPDLRQSLIKKTGVMTVPITTDGKDYVAGLNYGLLSLLGK